MGARRLGAALACALGLTAIVAAAPSGARDPAAEGYVVLYDPGRHAAAVSAVRAAGGTVVRDNPAVGLAVVRGADTALGARLSAAPAVDAVAADLPVGAVPAAPPEPPAADLAHGEGLARAGGRAIALAKRPPTLREPLEPLQWNLQMLRITRAHARTTGTPGVLVGVVDTGVDATHPDVAGNLATSLSRNFTVDDPAIDGPCVLDPDGSCADPPGVDENGHGTHVAGTIAAPVNGTGIAGVAPGVRIVSLRAGQDSGVFFLAPVVDALTYAADRGVDVVNLSFTLDPWRYACAANPADSAAAQAEQRTVRTAVQRAVDYARARGVTVVAETGDDHTDLGAPTADTASPSVPPGAAYPRTVDDGCLRLPVEARGVMGVAAVGPSGRKAYYSDYGTQQTDIAAPGGDVRDYPDDPLRYLAPENMVLGPYPRAVALARGQLDPSGVPLDPTVVRDCSGGACAYYEWLQGTGAAAPQVAGIAALVVSRYGHADPVHGGLTMSPGAVSARVLGSATDTACPDPPVLVYPDLPGTHDARCQGTPARNGFHGEGLADAAGAVGIPKDPVIPAPG